LTVNFDARESYDPFGLPITYHWNFDDGTESTDANPIHEFTTSDNSATPFNVTLTITDSLGLSSTSNLIISLNNSPPEVEITNPKNNSFYAMNGNSLYRLEADVYDAEHSNEELTYEWQTFVHHNTHNHPEASSFEVNPSTWSKNEKRKSCLSILWA